MYRKLEMLELRLETLNRMLMDPAVLSDGTRMREASREHSHVTHIVEAWTEHKKLQADLEQAKEMSQDSDPDMREMARAEIPDLEAALEQSVLALRLSLLPRDPYEGRPLLVEIRAGTGGDEAALFASDLCRMYTRYCETNGIQLEILSSSHITVGGGSGKSLAGYKEVILGARGDKAYQMLRFESGVHRVQRVPATETQGRIHTSAATVAVLPEPEEVELKIEAKDLRIDTMRAGGPGGQSVNTTDSAVRIVHIPTGMIVQCQDEKSQLKNKDKAMRVLKARLLEAEQAERHAEEAAARKAQVGSGDRSERIRTYNFPQNRVTDHRIGLTLYRLETVMQGDLQELIDGLSAAHQAELLASQNLK